MDTQWTDFFWRHQRATFDDAALNLMWALVRISLDPTSPAFAADTSALGGPLHGAGFTLFHDRGWLTPRFANHLMDLLEAWSAGGGTLAHQLPRTNHFDEAAFFQRAIATPGALRYLELVQFAALVFYLSHHRDAVNKDALQEWMRVVTNLAANSDIERPDDFGRSLAGLQRLVPHGNRILHWLAEPGIEISGFSPQQVREEALKARLILSRPKWRELIDDAEAHPYFQGQIEFLLKFSGVLDRLVGESSITWSEAEVAGYQKAFSEYLAKASAVFSAKGLNEFGAYRWERALLTKGDYLLQRGLNRSFLDNGERDANWKRLLRGSLTADSSIENKRQFVRELFDEIDLGKGVKESLDAVLAGPLPGEPWRAAVIEQAEIIEYCRERKVRWHQNGNVYLMRRVQMNGEHAELFTYHLKVGLLQSKHERGELAPFGAPQYQPVNGELEEPRAYLGWEHGSDIVILTIFKSGDSYLLRIRKGGGPLSDAVRDALVRDAAFQGGENGTVLRKVERATIEQVLDEIVIVVRRFESLVPNAPPTLPGA